MPNTARNTNRKVLGLLAIILLLGGSQLWTIGRLGKQADQACTDRIHQYAALHNVIVEQGKPAKPSEVVLRAFPQFRPFYTPGTPEYDESLRLSKVKTDNALRVLGNPPSCKE